MTTIEKRSAHADRMRQWRASNRDRARAQARKDGARWRAANLDTARRRSRECNRRRRQQTQLI